MRTETNNNKLRVSAVQMDCKLGDIEANAEKIFILASQAERDEGADLVVFPELSLTGYDNKEGFEHLSVDLDDEIFDKLKRLSRQVALMIGMVEERPRSMANYNTYGFLWQGEFQALARKIYPPTYSIFEEQKHFGKGRRLAPIEYKNFGVAPVICNDLWHPAISYLYHLMGVDVVVVPATSSTRETSPDWPESDEIWSSLLQFNALIYGSFIIFVNRAGSEAGLTFWGGSRIVSPFAEVVAEATGEQETIITAELDSSIIRRARKFRPYHRDEDPRFTRRELERIIKEYEY